MRTLISIDEISSLFNQELDEINEKYCRQPLYNKEIYEKVKSVINAACIMIREFEEEYKYDTEKLKSLRVDFQQKTNKVILQSYILNRIRTWPQGYQGDYKTLETVYRNTPLSDHIGYYLDLYALNNPLAIGVRNRLSMLIDFLRDELRIRNKPKVMNIACGSCRELMEISNQIKESKAKISCIDDDSDALNFSLNRLSYATSISQFTFRKFNAIRMFDNETNRREFGAQDVIYSIGLFDYLPDDFLVKLLEALYVLLAKNGTLILSFKDAAYYDPIVYHWIADWYGFRQRNETDFYDILNRAKLTGSIRKVIRDDSRIIVYFIIGKD